MQFSEKSFGIKIYKNYFPEFTKLYGKLIRHYQWFNKKPLNDIVVYFDQVDHMEIDNVKFQYVGWNHIDCNHKLNVPIVYDFIYEKDIIDEKFQIVNNKEPNNNMQKKYNDNVVFYSTNIGELMAAAFIFEKVTGLKMAGRSVTNFFEYYKKDMLSGHYPTIGLEDKEGITAFRDRSGKIRITDILQLEKALLDVKAPEPIGPTINGYIGKIEGTNIVFGCAKISLSIIEAADKLLLLGAGEGNRTVTLLTLSSGVCLSRNHVLDILAYNKAYSTWVKENK